MGKDHEGDIKLYFLAGEKWKSEPGKETMIDGVTFGFFSPEGGTSGEIHMNWYEIGNRAVPKLECYDDAWHALSHLKDVIGELAEVDDEGITPGQFCDILNRCGFEDATPPKWR